MQTFLAQTARKELVKTVASSATPERFTARSISTITRFGTTRRCLVTTSVAHGYENGAIVYISGAVEGEFNTPNGKMINVVSATTFEIMLDGTTAAATGTIVCYADIWVRQASILGQKDARTLNTGTVYVGGESANDKQAWPIVSGAAVSLPTPDMGEVHINLADWYLDVATNGDGIYVFYS